VTIFGSARVPKDHWVYRAVHDLAAELTRMDCDVVTGGGPGLMQAANEGARSADPDGKRKSVGIRVELPFEQNVNAFVSQAFEHRTFFTRLHQFVMNSDAFIVAPGGVGTLLEMVMIWQLLQVRHVAETTPLILVGDMWRGLIAWAKVAMLSANPPLANPRDMTIPVCVTNADEAVARIRAHHRTWRDAQQQRDKVRVKSGSKKSKRSPRAVGSTS